jgi:hypothetical protein
VVLGIALAGIFEHLFSDYHGRVELFDEIGCGGAYVVFLSECFLLFAGPLFFLSLRRFAFTGWCIGLFFFFSCFFW